MPSFGARLKREREQRGVTLEDISVSTKINTRMLQAIEEDHFEQLPGGIFNKGFVRAYARQLRLDEDEIIGQYLQASGEEAAPVLPEVIEIPAAHRPSADRPRSGLSWQIFAALVLLTLVGIGGLRYYSQRDQRAQSQPSATAAPIPPQASMAVTKTPTSPAPSAPTAGKFTVIIKAREDCWLSVTADGRQVFEGTLAGPSEKSVAADGHVVIKAGNIGAVDLFFDGKKLPLQGDYGEVKTIAFDASGLRPTPQAASVSGPR